MLIRDPVTRQASYDANYLRWMAHALNTIPGSPKNVVAKANAIGWASRRAASDTPWAERVDKPLQV